MKKLLLFYFLSLTFVFVAPAQQVTVSFQPKNSTETIDSVQVINLTKGQTVKLDAAETIVFTPPTSVNHIALGGTDNGYLYPNPFNDYTTLAFNTTKSRKVSIAIYTVSGQTIYSQTQSLSPGSHRFQLQFPSSGFYNVVVFGDKKPLSYKAVYTGRNQQKVDIQYLGSEELRDDNLQSNQLKSVRNEKSLDYSNGDVVHYIVYSGENATIIADAPTNSKTIEVEFFECKDPDGRNYKIVQIGDQWWMAENLAYLPSVSPPDESSEINPYYYVYDYEGADVVAAKATDNYKTYGVLYNLPAANESCPDGWHVPSDDEWALLEISLGITPAQADKGGWRGTDQGTQMKTTNGWSNNGNGTNKSGFSALPNGYFHGNDGYFKSLGNSGSWWSSSSYWYSGDTQVSGYRGLMYDKSKVTSGIYYISTGYNVRCVKEITEPTVLPIVSSYIVHDINNNSATSGGEVIFEGSTSVTERGVVWSISEEPTVNNNEGITSDGNGTGNFKSSVTGLDFNKTYYVRAYATNSAGTAYGHPIKFKTGASGIETGYLTDNRDDKTYKTVKIGDQWWMAENLAYLPDVSPVSVESEVEPHYYVLDYEGTDINEARANINFSTFGVLYNWPAAMNGSGSSDINPSGIQGICPEGWHLPSVSEWRELQEYLIENGYNYDGTTTGNKLAKSLAAKTHWKKPPNDPWGTSGEDKEANNSTGFSALPGTYAGGYYGYWWSSTSSGVSKASSVGMSWSQIGFFTYKDIFSKSDKISIRCIKGEASCEGAVLPSVDPTEVENFGKFSATVTSEVGDDGGAFITSRGVVWSTSESPTLDDNDGQIIEGTGAGKFTIRLTGLESNTMYYIRSYATNCVGNAYGNQAVFQTKDSSENKTGTFTDSRDNNSYKWIEIGDQIWMTENLAYLPEVSPSSEGSATEPHYYVYDYNGTDVSTAKATEHYTTFGVLYNWPAAMNGASSSNTYPSGVQGICPEGWHLPSNAEWTELENYLIAYGYNYDGTTSGNKIAKSLAATTHWSTDSGTGSVGNNLLDNNKSSFSGLPGGLYNSNGLFETLGQRGTWWSSTEYSNQGAFGRRLYHNTADLFNAGGGFGIANGYSVRCIRD